MLAKVLQLTEPQVNREELTAQLEKELMACEVSNISYRNKLKGFMTENEIWHISELDYHQRVEYEKYLQSRVNKTSFGLYIKTIDRVKLHSIRSSLQITVSGKAVRPEYTDTLLYLPYHPDMEIAEKFYKEINKDILVWDFTKEAPRKMKQQVFTTLHYFIEHAANRERMHAQLGGLRRLYDFCIEEQIEDIEKLELEQIERFKSTLITEHQKHHYGGITSWCGRALFMEAEEIHWDANVWYPERMKLQPERIDPSNPVKSISFAEVRHKGNRQVLQMYAKYGIGITNLSISNLRSELTYIRSFLEELNQSETENICMITPEQMDTCLRAEQMRDVQAETYNKKVMSILHFFTYLKVKGQIEKIPFDADYYIRKTFGQHYDRSVEQAVADEIMANLYKFPEDTRLMFLHLWGIGLRISEVCTLKGNAYYMQGEDAWIQVYQIKMRTYKRIPIPMAIYRLMKIYIAKYNRKADEYIFQNKNSGAYHKGTFKNKMIRACKECNIQNGEYIFRSHDYRHTIATAFYDTGVPIQSIRDYLGHDYEEMTRRYVDFMPKKIEKANEEYFKKGSLASCLGKEVEISEE